MGTQKNILVAVGPESEGLTSVQHALALAKRIPARVFILKSEATGAERDSQIPAEEVLLDLVAAARQAGLDLSYHTTRGPLEERIAGFIRDQGIHILVLGEEGVHLDRSLLRTKDSIPPQIILVKRKDREKGGDDMKEQLKILVLDDEPIVGDRLKPVLETEGYGVEVFVDPREAIKRLESEEFDIVITDVRMANIDGIQVLEYVRGRSDRTKVLIITGYATVQLAREALSKGVFDFIAKPFKMQDIRDMVQKAVEALRTGG